MALPFDPVGLIGICIIVGAIAAIPKNTESRWGKVAVAAATGFAGLGLLGDLAGLGPLGGLVGGAAGVTLVRLLVRPTRKPGNPPSP